MVIESYSLARQTKGNALREFSRKALFIEKAM
jgi:hypothetical protein